MNRFILSALGLSAALISAMPVAAQDHVDVRVSYADLNLSSSAGEAVFKQRMNNAITQICGKANFRDLGAMAMIRACRDTTSATADQQMRRVIAAARTAQPIIFAKADPAR